MVESPKLPKLKLGNAAQGSTIAGLLGEEAALLIGTARCLECLHSRFTKE